MVVLGVGYGQLSVSGVLPDVKYYTFFDIFSVVLSLKAISSPAEGKSLLKRGVERIRLFPIRYILSDISYAKTSS